MKNCVDHNGISMWDITFPQQITIDINITGRSYGAEKLNDNLMLQTGRSN